MLFGFSSVIDSFFRHVYIFFPTILLLSHNSKTSWGIQNRHNYTEMYLKYCYSTLLISAIMHFVKNKVILDFWRVCKLWRADAALHKSTKCGINENWLSHSHTVRDKVTQFILFKTYIKPTAEFHSKLNTTNLGVFAWPYCGRCGRR